MSALRALCALCVIGAARPLQSQIAAVAADSARIDSTDPRAAQPERPTVATHAYTVSPGFAELEAGIQVMRPAGANALAVPLVLKLGITPSTQFDLVGGYERYSAAGVTTSGQSDFALALKQRILRKAPLLEDVSVQASVKFPSGARGVTTSTNDYSILLISSRMLGSVELDLNAGYTRRSGDGSVAPINSTVLTASLGGAIAGPLGGTVELFGYPATSGASGSPTSLGSVVALTYALQKWLVLDAGAIVNVRNLGANALVAGFTYNMGRVPGFPAKSGTR